MFYRKKLSQNKQTWKKCFVVIDLDLHQSTVKYFPEETKCMIVHIRMMLHTKTLILLHSVVNMEACERRFNLDNFVRCDCWMWSLQFQHWKGVWGMRGSEAVEPSTSSSPQASWHNFSSGVLDKTYLNDHMLALSPPKSVFNNVWPNII